MSNNNLPSPNGTLNSPKKGKNGKKSVTIANEPVEIIPNPHALPGAPAADPYLLGSANKSEPRHAASGWNWNSQMNSNVRRGFSRGFRCSFPGSWTPSRAKAVGCTAGLFFAFGWWLFFDALIWTIQTAKQNGTVPKVPLRFEDWVPGVVSTLALIIVNLIDKEVLTGDSDEFYSGSYVSAKARLCAFTGLTLALGSICGAVVIFVLKYVNPGYSGMDTYFGISILFQNFLIFVGSMVFWFGRQIPEGGIQL